MAPTICEDNNDLSNSRSTRRVLRLWKSSVISFANRNRLTIRRVSSTSNVARNSQARVSEMDSDREINETILNSSAYQAVINDRNRTNVQRIDDDDSVDSTSSDYSVSNEQHNQRISFRGFTRQDIHSQVKVEKEANRDNSENDVSSTMEHGSTILITTSTTTSPISTPASSIYDDFTLTETSSILHSPHPTKIKRSATPAITFPSPPLSPYVVTSSNVSTTSSSALLLARSINTPSSPSTIHLTNGPHRVLIEIAIKTIKLLQKNRSLQERLEQLQIETAEFVDSVMANPENANIRKKIKYDNLQRTKKNCIKRSMAVSPSLTIRN